MLAAQSSLQETNRKLCGIVRQLAQSGPVCTIDIVGLLQDLSWAMELCRAESPPHDTGEMADLLQYRQNLEQLLAAIPPLRERLLTDRAKLEQECNHLRAATRWAQSQDERNPKF